MNTKQQGDIGVAAAVLHYTKNDFVVSQPLTDNSRYDLIIGKGNKLFRVQCKTTSYKRKNSCVYEVQLGTSGGNQSWNKKTKAISKDKCDIVFIYCLDETQYEYPAEALDGKSSLRLGPKQEKFKI